MKELPIKGLQKTSLVDYPGKVAATIFLGGCNFRCGFCQNPSLVVGYEKEPTLSENEVLGFLKERKKWLDGICITGGEPLLYDLTEFIKRVKELGYLVKVDTNGSMPERLKELVDKKLADYVAMDIKNSLERYDETAGVSVDKEKIKESVKILQEGRVEYEFRMTVIPGLHDEKEFQRIVEWLKGSKRFFLQQFRNEKVLDESFKSVRPFPPEKLEEFAAMLRPHFKEVGVRA